MQPTLPPAPVQTDRPVSPDDALNRFIRRARQEKPIKAAFSTPDNAPLRRAAGAALGLLQGLAFGLVSQFINPLAMPGVPLLQPPAGPLGNALLVALAGALAGLAAGWPSGFVAGVSRGVLVCFLGIVASIGLNPVTGLLLYDTSDPLTLLFMAFTAGLGFFFLVPLVTAHRWAVEYLAEHWGWMRRNYRGLLLPFALIAATAFIGTFAKFPADLRHNITLFDGFIERGLKAETEALLPPPLNSATVVDFPRHATQQYRILVLIGDSRPILAAVFDNGYTLVCEFAPDYTLPACRSFFPPGP